MSDEDGYVLNAFMKSALNTMQAKLAADVEELEHIIFTSLNITDKEEQNKFKDEAKEMSRTSIYSYSDCLHIIYNQKYAMKCKPGIFNMKDFTA